jgi:hypothetical protein
VTLGGELRLANCQFLPGCVIGGSFANAGVITWTGGQLQNAVLRVAVGGVLNVEGEAEKQLHQSTLDNAGTVNWRGSGTLLKVAGWYSQPSTINNLAGAVFGVETDAVLAHQYEPLTFNNAGTLVKRGGTGTTALNVTFNNTGLVEVQSGTLSIEGAAGGGQWRLAEGAGLSFNGGLTLESGTALEVPAGATVNFAGGSSVFPGGSALKTSHGRLLRERSDSATLPPDKRPGVAIFTRLPNLNAS